MNQILTNTIAFLKLWYLSQYFNVYHVTTSLPVDHENDKSDGLDDLNEYSQPIQSKMQQLMRGFGSNQIGMNCGAWFAHRHTLHATKKEMNHQDIAFTEAMLTAELPPHLRELEKGQVIKIKKVKRTALDTLRACNYLARHKKLDRTKYKQRIVEKSSYGKWPTLADLIDEKDEEEDEKPAPKKARKTTRKKGKRPAYLEFCRQDIEIFFAILFLTMAGISEHEINEIDEATVRGVYRGLFSFIEREREAMEKEDVEPEDAEEIEDIAGYEQLEAEAEAKEEAEAAERMRQLDARLAREGARAQKGEQITQAFIRDFSPQTELTQDEIDEIMGRVPEAKAKAEAEREQEAEAEREARRKAVATENDQFFAMLDELFTAQEAEKEAGEASEPTATRARSPKPQAKQPSGTSSIRARQAVADPERKRRWMMWPLPRGPGPPLLLWNFEISSEYLPG